MPPSRRSTIGYAVLLLLVLCASLWGLSARPATPEADEYAVWSAMLEHLYGGEPREMAVTGVTTALFPRPGERVERLMEQGIAPAMVDSFIARNQRKARVDHTRLRAGRARLVGERERDERTARIFLSRVAFDDARSRAVLEVFMNCGDLCGEGGMVEAVRDRDGGWKFVRRVYHYVS